MSLEDQQQPVVASPLSQCLTRNAITVQVEIYGDGEGKWILEVIDAQQTSHIWEDRFESDHDALAEAIRALEEEPAEFSASPPGTSH